MVAVTTVLKSATQTDKIKLKLSGILVKIVNLLFPTVGSFKVIFFLFKSLTVPLR